MTTDAPGLPEYPQYDVEVVSPELPCGAAWLANCLLELDVPLWNCWDIDTRHEWQRLAPFRYRYVADHLPWRQTLAALVVGRRFRFLPSPVPHFNHRWPVDLDARRPVIVFVRDPRDALHSEWRRQCRNRGAAATAGFETFLASPYYHYPFSFREYLLRFLRQCQCLLERPNALLVRFEDYKHAPEATLHRVMRFLGLTPSPTRIDTAIRRSDFFVLKEIEERLAARGELHREFNRSGTAFEYRQCLTPSMHDAIGAEFAEIYQWLNYQSHEHAREASRRRRRGCSSVP